MEDGTPWMAPGQRQTQSGQDKTVQRAMSASKEKMA